MKSNETIDTFREPCEWAGTGYNRVCVARNCWDHKGRWQKQTKATYTVPEREKIVLEIQEQMQKETGEFLPGIAIRQVLETITRNRKALDFLGRL